MRGTEFQDFRVSSFFAMRNEQISQQHHCKTYMQTEGRNKKTVLQRTLIKMSLHLKRMCLQAIQNKTVLSEIINSDLKHVIFDCSIWTCLSCLYLLYNTDKKILSPPKITLTCKMMDFLNQKWLRKNWVLCPAVKLTLGREILTVPDPLQQLEFQYQTVCYRQTAQPFAFHNNKTAYWIRLFW